jgi:hypothetical protein
MGTAVRQGIVSYRGAAPFVEVVVAPSVRDGARTWELLDALCRMRVRLSIGRPGGRKPVQMLVLWDPDADRSYLQKQFATRKPGEVGRVLLVSGVADGVGGTLERPPEFLLEAEHVDVRSLPDRGREVADRLDPSAVSVAPVPACDGRQPFLFVSYAQRDRPIVCPAVESLARHGFRVWYDEGLVAAEVWRQVIDEHLGRAAQVVVFLTDNALASTPVMEELRQVGDMCGWDLDALRSRLFPCTFDDDDCLDRYLAGLDRIHPALCRLQAVTHLGHDGDPAFLASPGRDARSPAAAGAWKKLCRGLGDTARDTVFEREVKALGLGRLPGSRGEAFDLDGLMHRYRGFCREIASRADAVPPPFHVPIDTVFQITSEQTGAIASLLDLGRERLADATAARPSNVLRAREGDSVHERRLDVESTFVSPLRLLTGLATKLDENWPPLIDAYRRLVGKSGGTLLDFHYFVTFCWLSWGPSILTTSGDGNGNESRYAVLQAATGDEFNSLPLIVSGGRYRDVFAPRLSREGGSPWGFPTGLRGVEIVVPDSDPALRDLCGTGTLKGLFDGSVALYFGDGAEILPVRATHGDGDPGPADPGPYYSTAYLWLMIERVGCEADGDIPAADRRPDPRMTPGRVLPFFEHANLASRDAVEFLLASLVRKVLEHVVRCETRYPSEGWYRYSTALFDEQTREELARQVEAHPRRDVLVRRLHVTNRPTRSPADVVGFVAEVHGEVDRMLR